MGRLALCGFSMCRDHRFEPSCSFCASCYNHRQDICTVANSHWREQKVITASTDTTKNPVPCKNRKPKTRALSVATAVQMVSDRLSGILRMYIRFTSRSWRHVHLAPRLLVFLATTSSRRHLPTCLEQGLVEGAECSRALPPTSTGDHGILTTYIFFLL